MIWYDIKKPESDLTLGNVNEKDTFYYLLVTALISTLLLYLSDYHQTNQLFSAIELIVEIFMTILILKTTFDINTRGDNKEYLKRYISLSLVLIIRLLVFAILPMLAGVILMKVLASMGVASYKSMESIFKLSLIVVLVMVYYFMLTNSFRRINSGD